MPCLKHPETVGLPWESRRSHWIKGSLKICWTLIESKPNIPIRRYWHASWLEAVLQLSTTIVDLVITWQRRRINIWGATNATQNFLQSGRICFYIFFHLDKRILGRHCLQNYLQYATQNHVKHVKAYITSLSQSLGTVPRYTMSK